MTEPDFEYEDQSEDCKDCGGSTYFTDCWQCGGEGYRDDLYEEDPMWYAPGDIETCEICEGKGGWYVCEDKKCRETLTKSI